MAKATAGFDKFINPKLAGAKKKETLKQEKRKAKAEARAVGEAMRQKKREAQQGWQYNAPNTAPSGARPGGKRTFTARDHQTEKEQLQQWADSFVKGDIKKAAALLSTAKPAAAKKSYKTDKQGYEPQWQKRVTTPNNNLTVNKGTGAATARTTKFKAEVAPAKPANEKMPLNKFIAYAGICGRREAAEIVKAGKVEVNGDKVYEPGFKVSSDDKIKFGGKLLHIQHNLVYILLNKPKDYITTVKDPEGRKTVLDLVKDAAQQRIYPVGRLDRNTTGVLLMTNDGELAQKLTHPSFQVKKIYEVKLDKVLTKTHFQEILQGIQLEDGFIAADSLAYADAKDKSIIGIEIHSGRNRIVRRLFEHLGYDVRNLDRVMFANLTKKNVERGKWRFLNEKEIRNLKFLNSSFTKK